MSGQQDGIGLTPRAGLGVERDDQKGITYMRLIPRSVCVALLAAFVMSAFAAASASAALPEFKGETGKITGTMGKAKFSALGASWACEKGTNSGEYVNSTTLGNVALTFKNCNKAQMECYTHENGPSSVELALSGLQAKLGYLAKATKVVGLKFEMAKNKCEDEDFGEQKYVGNLIGSITPINTKTKSFTVHIVVVAAKQEFVALEGEASNPFKVTSGVTSFGEIAEVAEVHFTTEKETEIAA
jgi:opacity protein-like surface antigen